MAQSRSRDASPSDDVNDDADDVDAKMGDEYNFESTSSSSSSFSPLLNVDDAFLDDEHKKLFSKLCDILPPTGSENGAASSSSSLDYYEFDDTDARERIANRELPPSENDDDDDDDMIRMLYVCLESLKNLLMTFIDLFPRMPFVLVLVSPFPRAPSERTRKWRVWKSPAFCLLETELRERRQRMEQPPPSPPQADSSSPPRPALTLDEMTFLCREFGLIPPPSDDDDDDDGDHNGGFIASAV